MAELKTDNQEYIIWEYEQLKFALLGGFKTEGLERMRVTLKVEYKLDAVRHNLDLYNNESLDKLVKRCAERFTLNTSYISTAFAELVNLLEAYRLEQLKKLAVHKETVKQLTEAESRKAEDFLRSPDLLQRTNCRSEVTGAYHYCQICRCPAAEPPMGTILKTRSTIALQHHSRLDQVGGAGNSAACRCTA